MMTNLFSTFDPATSMNLSMNWMSSFILFIMMPMPYWLLPNRSMMLLNKTFMKLHYEFKMLLMSQSKGLTLIMISTFLFIIMNNFMGIMSYIFTSSSHLVFSLAIYLPLWLSMMMFGWFKNTNHMFADLVPLGTPNMLMPFMVIIETISNLIRPGSLAVRLTANMIAGHLLMSLLGNKTINSEEYMFIMGMIQMMLMMFEMAVAIIQSYVFSVLMTLYSSEVMKY